MPVELIYCAAFNKRFAEIAIDAGFLYGARLPGKLGYPVLTFADHDWRQPGLVPYLWGVKAACPDYATVIDIDQRSKLSEALHWCDVLSPYVKKALVVVPKISGVITKIPKEVNGVEIRLGYSVPTSYGKTDIPIHHFGNWPVHLLGGRPEVQMGLFSSLNVLSVDCNYHMLIAQRYGDVWMPFGKYVRLPKGGHDNIYKAFEESCKNLIEAWRSIFLL